MRYGLVGTGYWAAGRGTGDGPVCDLAFGREVVAVLERVEQALAQRGD